MVAAPLCLGNISKDGQQIIWKQQDFTVMFMTLTGLHGYVYDFSVDYDAIAVDDILDIHIDDKKDIV